MGHVTFASGLVVPAPVDLHPISQQSHGVSSGMVTVMDTRKLVIKKLIYDGQCPGECIKPGDSGRHQDTGHQGAHVWWAKSK